jgi:hypothetical protein
MKNMKAFVLAAAMLGMSGAALGADDAMDPNMKMPKDTSAAEHKKHKHSKKKKEAQKPAGDAASAPEKKKGKKMKAMDQDKMGTMPGDKDGKPAPVKGE